ncbi:MAG: Crp/Fnr family transcriptional regulator [Defluviitaleaceae bacterium]|nr:Crp/Fnr family transcriptional regulator [Defluviitaleaceae bacterium]
MEIFEKCKNTRIAYFKKGEIIIEAGAEADEFGFILEGSVQSIKWNATGKMIIITMVEKGGAIGVLLAASPGRVSPLTVQATRDTTVMMVAYNKILTPCDENCINHKTMLQNFITLVAEKGLELHERINCLLEPTVREKILNYLHKISCEKKSLSFSIPINRNIMAEYLNVERSALSRELSRMKKDGLIDYERSYFVILKWPCSAYV